ncbi:hypothetical protein LJC29_07065 [Bacteroides sp. OttesenSCG-928-N06]|nr:hypothetical protein [Bacteroides sp. OttesenSCG-928-N06]
MKKKIKKNVSYYVIIFFVLCFTVWVYFNGHKKNVSLKNNLIFSKAIIIKFSTGPRMRHYVDYEFAINGELYQGTELYYPKSDTFSVGDTINIVYDRTNPKNNRTVRDYFN